LGRVIRSRMLPHAAAGGSSVLLASAASGVQRLDPSGVPVTG
jgi:hypothetical protein